ncbi:uncharacterized protein J4E79_011704 [Alternaria viburni]|uniref:uncharacterized protein n=1 Tax=Alternaria viburni TaxID=566460 RepID=UPI0020C4EFFD|nr:uncharacterized protein J4E79_011704 [Alternaria viburni]KAI4641312.1 hypothetical protein J4E79_011704 [Alternaria viburni]
MSSQERNQEHATNLIVIHDEYGQKLWGPFSNSKEHLASEMEVFVNRIRKAAGGPVPDNVVAEWKEKIVPAVEELIKQAEVPDLEQKLWWYLVDHLDFDDTLKTISLKQGFQKDTAIAMKRLAAGEELGEYKSMKEPSPGYGPGIDLYSVSVRTVRTDELDRRRVREIEEVQKRLIAPPRYPLDDMSKLWDRDWRFQNYAEHQYYDSPLEGDVEVFVSKVKAIAYAENLAEGMTEYGPVETDNIVALHLGESESRKIYELKSERISDLELRGLPFFYKLVIITHSHVCKEHRADLSKLEGYPAKR